MYTNAEEEALVLMHYEDWLRESRRNGHHRNAEMPTVNESILGFTGRVSGAVQGLVCRLRPLESRPACSAA